MSVGLIILIIVIVIIIGCVIAAVAIYNGIVSERNRVYNAWQDVDANLQRRNDLIPNLINTVKGYAAHETGVFEAVSEARAASVAAQTPEQTIKAEGALANALRGLFAVAKNYPDLKASQNFLALQQQLNDAEDRIAYARQAYNDCVYTYNTAIQTFPGNLMAPLGQFVPFDGFEVTKDEARSTPNVTF